MYSKISPKLNIDSNWSKRVHYISIKHAVTSSECMIAQLMHASYLTKICLTQKTKILLVNHYGWGNSLLQPQLRLSAKKILQGQKRRKMFPALTQEERNANGNVSDKNFNQLGFNQAAPPYQKALNECGYRYTLHYEPRTTNNRKNRQRNNILWCNSPFSKNVSTNIGHRFLALIDKYFPKDHNLENF